MKEPLKVLMVEDSEEDADMIIHELRRGGFEPKCRRVYNASGLSAALKDDDWNLVISDNSMPGFGSLNALAMVKETKPDVPFIIVSGTADGDVAIAAMKLGARDCVNKGHLSRLTPIIRREMRRGTYRSTRRECERNLARGQREFEELFDVAGVGLLWASREGIITRVNEAQLNMLGRLRSECVGRNITDFLADGQAAAEIFEKLEEGGKIENFPARLNCGNGRTLNAALHFSGCWEDGELVYIRCLTMPRNVSEKTDHAQAHLASIVASSGDAIFTQTLDGFILSWNAAAEAMYGYSPEEIKGRPGSILVCHDRVDDSCDALEKVRRGETVGSFETARRCKDGRRVEVSVRLSPVRNEAGAVVAISSIERNISREKLEEHDRLTLIEELTEALNKSSPPDQMPTICPSCTKVRDGDGNWMSVESYLTANGRTGFTHDICPECAGKMDPEFVFSRHDYNFDSGGAK